MVATTSRASAPVLGVELDDAVHVGGRAADVDDHHVARPGPLGVEAAREQLDAREDDVRGRAAHHLREVGALAEVLAADDVGQEHLADRGPGRVGREHADPRHHVVGQHVRDIAQDVRDLVAGLDVAGDHDRAGPAGLDQVVGGSEQRVGVAAVGAARQQHHVRPGRPREGGVGVPVRRTTRLGDDPDDLAAAGQGNSSAGLGGDQLLVADHGDAQSAARAGAGEHVRVGRPSVLVDQRGQAGVVPVEHVGADRGRVLGRGHDPPVGQVDQ